MKLLKDIKKGTLAPVYLFYGEEKYKWKVYKNALTQSVPYGNQMNYSFFEGKDIDFQKVYDAVVTLPFFAEKRLVIVENSGKFKGKKKSDGEASEEETSAVSGELLLKILEDLPETTCLAFFEEGILKTKKIYKQIAKKGAVEECAEDKAEDVKKWVVKGFRSCGMQIRPDALDLLVERAGTDYTLLLHEIEKLTAYAAGQEMISKEDVLAVGTHNIESKIFEIMDHMSSKNTEAVLMRYYDMVANREEPRMIMAMIRRQFRIMLQTAELTEQGYREDEITKITKNHPYVIKKMKPYLRKFSRSEMIGILNEINEIDMKSKNGDLDAQIGVELLLIRASS